MLESFHTFNEHEHTKEAKVGRGRSQIVEGRNCLAMYRESTIWGTHQFSSCNQRAMARNRQPP